MEMHPIILPHPRVQAWLSGVGYFLHLQQERMSGEEPPAERGSGAGVCEGEQEHCSKLCSLALPRNLLKSEPGVASVRGVQAGRKSSQESDPPHIQPITGGVLTQNRCSPPVVLETLPYTELSNFVTLDDAL